MTAIICNGSLEYSLKGEIEECRTLIAVDGGLRHFVKMGLAPDLLIGDFDSIDQDLLAQVPKEKRIKLNRAKDKTDLEAALERIEDEKMVIYGGLDGRLDHILTHLFILLRYPLKLSLKSETEQVFALTGTLELSKDQNLFFYPLNGPSTLLLNKQKIHVTESLSLTLHEESSLTLDQGEVILFLLKEKTTPLVKTLKTLPGALFIEPGEKKVFPSQRGLTISLLPFYGPASGITTAGLKWNLEGGTLDKNFVGLSNICLEDSFSISLSKGKLLLINPGLIDLEMLTA